MFRPIATTVGLTMLLGQTVLAQEMVIGLGGKPVGWNRYKALANGVWESAAEMNLGGKTSSEIKWQLKDGAVDFQSATMTAAGKTHKATKVGKVYKIDDVELKVPAYQVIFSNLHPQMLAGIPKALGTETKKTVKVLLIESFQVLDMSIQRNAKTVSIAGRVFDAYTLDLAGLKIDVGIDSKSLEVGGINVPVQKFSIVKKGCEALFEDPIDKYPELSKATYQTKTLTRQKMLTRDGATLFSDVTLPTAPGRYPAVLVRTPYGRAASLLEIEWLARRGYAVVAQDCRGRGASGGKWDPFINERKDGYDAIEWISQQPWCDGKVGMIGGSYSGAVQWQAAVEGHPALKCIVPQVSPPDAMLNLPYCYGTFLLSGSVWWGYIVRGQFADFSRITTPGDSTKLLTLPLKNLDKAYWGEEVPFWDKWLERDEHKDWTGWNFQEDMSKVTIPALHISGWWDGDNIGTRTNWQIMRELGRDNQWLIYGPWEHGFNRNQKYIDEDYGPQSLIEIDSLYLRWFDTWLKGKDVGMTNVQKARVFVTGLNEWRMGDSWPSKNAAEQSLYFSSKRKARGLTGDGELLNQPQGGPSNSYAYDPIAVGKDYLAQLKKPSPPTLRMKPSDTNGALVFKTPVLEKPLEIGGPIRVDFHYSTTAKDADFFAILVDVDPSGTAKMIGLPGAFRASYQDMKGSPKPITPNKIYRGTIEVWDTAHHFKKGHRFGVILTSNLFPMYARNLGLGEPIATATKMIRAVHTVYSDEKHPSRVRFFTPPQTAFLNPFAGN